MNTLEHIEWTQYWAEECASGFDRKHLLMIGDSISVGYRSAVYERVKSAYRCVTISTSKAIDNTSIMREIDFIAHEEGFEYPVVHFNNGLHGWHLSTEDYAKHYEEAVKFLIEKFPNSRIILALSTPITVYGNTSEYDDKNLLVIERNEKVCEIAKKYGLEINDLYSLVLNHPEYRSDDGYHYHTSGYDVMAEQIANMVL